MNSPSIVKLPKSDSSPGGQSWTSNELWTIGAVVALIGGFGWLFQHGTINLFEAWSREEYSHGPIIPLIALYLVVRHFSNLNTKTPKGSWGAVPIAFLGAFFGVIGALSNIADLSQYGMVISFFGVLVAAFGFSRSVGFWAPVIYLGFMIPLPEMIYLKLFAWTQLISSNLGTLIVRLVGIPVFLEGNIIDLGNYKLQVVEACAGLRYLFPLMSFGFLFAIVYQGVNWARVMLFLSTIPIAILMNSLRIGVIGVLVQNFGIEQAEGFLHFSEGWVIFIVSIAILYAEATLFTFFGNSARAAWASLDLGFEHASRGIAVIREVRTWKPLLSVAIIFVMGAFVISALQNDTKTRPKRTSFAVFPATFGEWTGRRSSLPQQIEDVLAADDYILADYTSEKTKRSVNLFVAYYDTQNEGNAPHSPEVCIPGQGWEISNLKAQNIALTLTAGAGGTPIAISGINGSSIKVNRAIIQKGTRRQLVYYWFRERERVVASEYTAKWYIFWDSITRDRTDGAMIRLITNIDPNSGAKAADQILTRYMSDVLPNLERFFPK